MAVAVVVVAVGVVAVCGGGSSGLSSRCSALVAALHEEKLEHERVTQERLDFRS